MNCFTLILTLFQMLNNSQKILDFCKWSGLLARDNYSTRRFRSHPRHKCRKRS